MRTFKEFIVQKEIEDWLLAEGHTEATPVLYQEFLRKLAQHPWTKSAMLGAGLAAGAAGFGGQTASGAGPSTQQPYNVSSSDVFSGSKFNKIKLEKGAIQVQAETELKETSRQVQGENPEFKSLLIEIVEINENPNELGSSIRTHGRTNYDFVISVSGIIMASSPQEAQSKVRQIVVEKLESAGYATSLYSKNRQSIRTPSYPSIGVTGKKAFGYDAAGKTFPIDVEVTPVREQFEQGFKFSMQLHVNKDM